MSWPRRTRSLGVPWLGLPLAAVLALVALGQSFWDPDLLGSTTPAASTSRPEMTGTPSSGTATRPEPVRSPDRRSVLRSGDTLSGILQQLGLPLDEAFAASTATAQYVDLRQLRTGTPWSAYLDRAGRLEKIRLDLAGRGELTVSRAESGWTSSWREFRREVRQRVVRGEVRDSFGASVERAGAPPELAYAIAEVLQWDLDFSRDLRAGDRFQVLYEEVSVEGGSPQLGRVLAVSYEQPGGHPVEAYYFERAGQSGYYDANGHPLQKMFLRCPLPYSRITSRFSNHRLHPILGVVMPHHGVDYGAPIGTPVRATASGSVAFAGWHGGGGRMVEVRHPNGYLTGYLHLSGFAKGVRRGAHVEQGEVIGYVGESGLATGPHLDYRVQVHGRWVDPLSLRSIPAPPIPSEDRADYLAVRDAMRARLEVGTPGAPAAIAVAAADAALPAATRAGATGR